MGEQYRNGLSTAAHDNMDVQSYFSLVYEAVCHRKGGLIADIFCGGGRDIAAFHSLLNGQGRFVAIDADPLRIKDALAKNDDKGAPLFTEVRNNKDLKAAFAQQKIAVMQGNLPEKPFGETNISLKGKTDFILCCAGIMFVPAEKIEKTLSKLADMLAPKGEMFLRFSQEREDQAANPKYHVHDPAFVSTLLEQKGLKITRNPDLPDPNARPFSWVDLHCLKI